VAGGCRKGSQASSHLQASGLGYPNRRQVHSRLSAEIFPRGITLRPLLVVLMTHKTVDWNELSRMGLIERINREIMHPIGLAVCREVESGISPGALVSEDGEWRYPEPAEVCPVTDEEGHRWTPSWEMPNRVFCSKCGKERV